MGGKRPPSVVVALDARVRPTVSRISEYYSDYSTFIFGSGPEGPELEG